ncbi:MULTISPECIES: hypothetical protein [Pseudomonas syringae group]|uniref:hypothetical protein n=1 Tax=Pseudomonas syringae group TaxID=136849 RepID=UPI0011C373B9|nr:MULTISPECIES: hypothetical protein [Pseudomonas syringae group]
MVIKPPTTMPRGDSHADEIDLNKNDCELLLRHCKDDQPSSGDFREDARLADALEALTFAIKASMSAKHLSDQTVGAIDRRLLEAAIGICGNKAIALK